MSIESQLKKIIAKDYDVTIDAFTNTGVPTFNVSIYSPMDAGGAQEVIASSIEPKLSTAVDKAIKAIPD